MPPSDLLGLLIVLLVGLFLTAAPFVLCVMWLTGTKLYGRVPNFKLVACTSIVSVLAWSPFMAMGLK